MAKKKKKTSNTRKKGPGQAQGWRPYEHGDKSFSGTIISVILGQSPQYCVYFTKHGGLGWEIKGLPVWVLPADGECMRLIADSRASVSRKYRKHISLQLSAALIKAFETTEKDDCLMPFAAVKTFIEEKKKEIRETYADENEFAVYIKSDNSVELWHKNLTDRLKPVVSEFERLQVMSQINLPKNYHRHVSGQLAWAVTGAFRGGEDHDFKPAFAKVEQFIESRTFAKARFLYVMASIFTASIGITIALSLYAYYQVGDSTVTQFILGGCSGMIGALLSVLQRGHKLKLDPMAPRQNIFMQSATRILIGMISGTIIVIATKSELALGLVANNNYALMLLAVISGFSERYVPDLMENISSSTKTAPGDKSEEDKSVLHRDG